MQKLRVFGAYWLLERIGVGGTAEVFRAMRRDTAPVHVALKRLLPMFAEDPAIAALFLREVGALQRIDHQAVVRLLDAGEVDGAAYLVMPLLGGCSLRRLLKPHREDLITNTLPLDVALLIAAQMARGLAAAHRVGVVHRDVSPTNVQVLADGSVVLLDFGIARVAGMAQTTHGQGLRGKFAYLSPEQIAGDPLDGRSDLFALASVFVEMLTGSPPFAGQDRLETLSRVQAAEFIDLPQLPAPLNALLRQLFAHAPNDRPADGDKIADALLAHLETAQIQDIMQRIGALVAQVPPVRQLTLPTAAEHQGEQVTDPATDADVTQVQIDS